MSTVSRPSIDRLSSDYQPIVDRVSTESRPTISIDRSVDTIYSIQDPAKQKPLLVHLTFLYTSLPFLHAYEVKLPVKLPSFTLLGGHKQATTKFCSLSKLEVLCSSPLGPCGQSSSPRLFQNERRCSAFDREIIFPFHANKTHFHKKGCAPSLILKVRGFGTRKWPINAIASYSLDSDFR